MTEEAIARQMTSRKILNLNLPLVSRPFPTDPLTVTIHPSTTLGKVVPAHSSLTHTAQGRGRRLQKRVLCDEQPGVFPHALTGRGCRAFTSGHSSSFCLLSRFTLSRRTPDSWERVAGYRKKELKIVWDHVPEVQHFKIPKVLSA